MGGRTTKLQAGCRRSEEEVLAGTAECEGRVCGGRIHAGGQEPINHSWEGW